MRPGAATAVAHANIALIKYWGKQDTQANLPAVPSLSMTLDGLKTTTRVVFDSSLQDDRVELDGSRATGKVRQRAIALLDRVRQRAGVSLRAHVTSENAFPTASGLASSASGFAALAVAASGAAGLELSTAELSAMARQSSASAARSLFGGFAALGAGSAAAEPIQSDWDLRMLVALTGTEQKGIGSTEAMLLTAETSPYYPAWVERSPALFRTALRAVEQRDLAALGAAMEHSTWLMHACALGAAPSVRYLKPQTLSVISALERFRAAVAPCFYTMDAGPHVKVLCSPQVAPQIEALLSSLSEVVDTIVCGPGPAASLVSVEHP